MAVKVSVDEVMGEVGQGQASRIRGAVREAEVRAARGVAGDVSEVGGKAQGSQGG